MCVCEVSEGYVRPMGVMAVLCCAVLCSAVQGASVGYKRRRKRPAVVPGLITSGASTLKVDMQDGV